MDLNVYNIHFLTGLFGKPEAVSYHANVERGIDTSGILTMDYGSFQAVCIGAKDCQAPLVSTLQGDGGYIRMTAPVSRNVNTNYLIIMGIQKPFPLKKNGTVCIMNS